MAKTQRKQAVSTKAMFSKAGKDILHPSKTKKANKVSKNTKHTKAKQVPEHELAKAFSESIDLSRENIFGAAASNYSTAYTELAQRLTEIEHENDEERRAFIEEAKSYAIDFDSEMVEFRTDDGKQTGVVALSHRMRTVQKVIDDEVEELNRQWDEWVESEAEIDRLAAEVNALETLVQLPGVNGQPGIFVTAEQAEMLREIDAERKKFEKMMDEAAKSSIREMHDSEKKMKLKQKKIADEMSTILQDMDYY